MYFRLWDFPLICKNGLCMSVENVRPAASRLRGAYTTPLLQGFHFISGIQFNLVVVVFQYFLILSTGCGHFEEPT